MDDEYGTDVSDAVADELSELGIGLEQENQAYAVPHVPEVIRAYRSINNSRMATEAVLKMRAVLKNAYALEDDDMQMLMDPGNGTQAEAMQGDTGSPFDIQGGEARDLYDDLLDRAEVDPEYWMLDLRHHEDTYDWAVSMVTVDEDEQTATSFYDRVRSLFSTEETRMTAYGTFYGQGDVDDLIEDAAPLRPHLADQDILTDQY